MKLYQRFLPYGVAIGSTAIALLLSLWLEAFLSRTIGAFFYIAIIVSAWYGGFRAGSVAIVLSMLAINYFFLPPVHYLLIGSPGDILRLGIFLMVALVINLLTSNLQESKNKIARLNQQLIQENAAQLQMALSAARMGMWDWNLVTGEVNWSPEHAVLFGLEPGSFDGKYETFDARVHPEDRSGLNLALKQALHAKSIYQHEFRVIWPDGSIHWVEGRGQGFYDQTGKAVGMTGTIMNVDDRKQTETLLHQQFEQQRLVMEISGRIRQSLDLQDILQTTVEEVRQFLQCDRALIFKIAPDYSGTILVESVAPGWNSISSKNTFDPCVGKEYIAPFEQGLVTAKSDIYTAEIAACHREMLAGFQVRANLVVPILQGENLWGLLVVHQCAVPREWQASEIDLLRQLSAQASIAIQQADLFEQVQTQLKERKLAEQALQESEEKLQLFIKYAPASIVMFDREMRYLSASQRWVDDYRLESLESIIGRSHYEVFPDIPERWKQVHQRCLAGGIEQCEEDLFERENGEQQWIRWQVHPWYRSNGDIGGIILFSEDITKRKQAEIALQQLNIELEQRVLERTAELTEVNARLLVTLLEKERAYQLVREQAQLLDLAHDSIITWDLNSVITFWNQGAELMYGWTKAEALGQEVHILLKSQFPQPLAEIKAEIWEKGYWEGELIHFTKDERQIAVSSRWVAQKDDAGKPIKTLEINNNITQRKQAELALKESEEQRRLALDLTNIGFWDWHIPTGKLIWNDNHFTLLGLVPGTIEPSYEYWEERLHPEDRERVKQAFIDSLERRTDYKAEYRVVHPDGSVHWLMGRAKAIYNELGQPVRSLGVLLDTSDRKQAEQKLDLQAVIVRNMAEGICLIRADNGVIVYANPKFEQMFGYHSGELNGQHFSPINYATELVSAEDLNQVIQSAVLQDGEFTYEIHNVKKDGTPFWCSATCSMFRHSEYGDVLVAVHQDISDRKQAEESLRQKARQEELLRLITQAIRQSLDLKAILDTAVTEVRQTLQTDRAAIYRFNPDWSGDFVVESVGKDWIELVGVDGQKVWEDTYLQETQAGSFRNNESFVVNDIYNAGLQPCHIELLEQFEAKSYAIFPIFLGETLWGLLATYQNSKPRYWRSWELEFLKQIASQLSIAIQQSELYGKLQIELQERKQAEATIREAERRWRSLLDNVHLIVVGLDRWGNVNYVNPFFLSLTGYTSEEVLGKNWFENFLPRSSKQSIKAVFSELLNYKVYPFYRNAILTKSGEERFIAWNNTTLQDSQGSIIGSISIGEDITEREKIEKIKDEFIGIVSHELRTPLTAIQMSLGLLKTGIYDKKPEKSRRMIEIALLDTNRLVNLVNDILDLERLESGRAVLEKTLCPAADLMQQAVDGIQAIALQQQISLIVIPTDVEVWAAADAIIQTLTNLLSNAIKFSPAHATIHLSAEQQTDGVLFKVSDRGRGIPADKLELIFGRFQQVDASDSREKGGTGLGLAICRSIIERHGGKIWAESILSEGSTFFFTLPLRSDIVI